MAILHFESSADRAISVEEFIALKNTDEITYYNYSLLQYLNGFDMFLTNILYDYEEELQDMTITITFNSKERIKYQYKPELLAFDLYGSTEASFIIMMLNGIIDPKEFDFEKVKVISSQDLVPILSRIQSVNDEFLRKNRAKLTEDFSQNQGNTVWIE